MKKTFILLIFFLLAFFLNILAEEILIATSEWPPYEYTDNNSIIGSDVEIVLAAFEKVGVKNVKVEMFPWKRCVAMAQNKEVTAIFSLGKNPEREEYLYFPKEPINLSENVFFYRKGENFKYNNNLEDLKGLTIGVTAGYNYGKEFMESPLFKLEATIKDELSFKKLVNNRIDMFVCDKLVAIYLLKSLDLINQVDYLPTPLSKINMFLGFSKTEKSKELLEKFEKGLSIIKKDGTYDKIMSKYLN